MDGSLLGATSPISKSGGIASTTGNGSTKITEGVGFLSKKVAPATPENKPVNIEKTAVAARDNLRFTAAQPTGQSAVNTLPSALR